MPCIKFCPIYSVPEKRKPVFEPWINKYYTWMVYRLEQGWGTRGPHASQVRPAVKYPKQFYFIHKCLI